MQKKGFMQYIEKVLWLIECVKSSLWSFMLETSCWMMLHSRVDKLRLIVIKSRYWLKKCYTMPETANMLKISKSSIVFAPAWLC